MESTEPICHTLHLLDDGYFIDEVELDRTKDFWLGKAGSDNRMWLSNDWNRAKALAEEKIENSMYAAERNGSELLLR